MRYSAEDPRDAPRRVVCSSDQKRVKVMLLGKRQRDWKPDKCSSEEQLHSTCMVP